MEAYNLPEGVITVSYCDKDLSIGTLTLEPGKELERHNRPVKEELLQIKGKGGLRIFEDGESREVIFEEGDTFEIPANKDHQHINPSGEESVVMWKFEGDIAEIVQDIRDKFEEV